MQRGRALGPGPARLVWSSATAIVLVAAVVAVIAYSALSGKHLRAPKPSQASKAPAGALAEVRLPAGLYEALLKVGERLVLAGTPARNGICHSALLSPRALSLSARRAGACDDPSLYYRPTLPVERPVPGAVNGSTFSVAHAGPNGSWRTGPVLARWTDLAGTAPATAYGAGYLWAYLPLSSRGGQLLAVSESSGKLLDRVTVPEVADPLLVAAARGAWFAAGASLGPPFEPGLYHVGLASTKPALVVNAVGAKWVTNSTNSVFFAAASRLYTVSSAGRVLESPSNAPSPASGPNFAGAVTGYVPGPKDELWAVTGSGCTLAVTELDPANGAYQTVAVLPAVRGCGHKPGSVRASVAASGPDLFFVIYDRGERFSYLYRLRP